jgi:hypothetical protein
MSASIHKIDNKLLPILKTFFQKEYDFNDELDKIHNLLITDKLSEKEKEFHNEIKKIGVDDRNSVFIQKFHTYVDKFPEFNEAYFSFLKTNIVPLFSNEEKLVVQKTPNLRISFPNLTAIGKRDTDVDNVIGFHSDSDFGHHETEINFVIPITKMFDTNSFYYEPCINSSVSYEDYCNLKLDTDEMVMAYFNKLKHYNKINHTGSTRISFDIRIIPYSKYMENIKYFEGTKFELGKYYIVL